MARVLITGGTGLVGRRAAAAFESLSAGDEVVSRGRETDLLSPRGWDLLFDEVRPEVVIHLAWSASSLPGYRHSDDNWRWAESTVSGARTAVERGIVFLGTGTAVDSSPVDDPYSRSKAATRAELGDEILAGAVGWLRPYYVFDEEAPSPAVLRAAFDARSSGEPVRLATPSASHDFIHARDVGSAIVTVVASGLMGVIDIGSGWLTRVSDLVEAHGCSWIGAGAESSDAANSETARIDRLRGAGWSPVLTESRLRRPASAAPRVEEV